MNYRSDNFPYPNVFRLDVRSQRPGRVRFMCTLITLVFHSFHITNVTCYVLDENDLRTNKQKSNKKHIKLIDPAE